MLDAQPDNAKTKGSSLRRILSITVTMVIAVVLLWLAFRGVDWNAMRSTVEQGRLEWLFAAFLIVTISYFMRALRWRILLSGGKQGLHPLTVFWGTSIGYLGNAFLPARAGELMRTAFINQRTGIKAGFVLATVFTERIFDACFLVVMALLMFAQLDNIPDWLVNATQVMGIIGGIAFLALLLLPYMNNWFYRILNALPLPEKVLSILSNLLETFTNGVRGLQNVGRAISFVLMTIVIWSIDVGFALAIANAFDITMSISLAILLLAALGLSSAVPSTPGYVGVYQFVAVTVLTPFAITQNDALVYILALQAVTYAIVITFGGIAFGAITFSRSNRDEDTAPSQ